ncbi:MAG: bifunctional nuclease family protein [Deltaproteobacteria bacterium]|nr:bifunctional nuclease family protein [Deltaproteobacteria bacterium]
MRLVAALALMVAGGGCRSADAARELRGDDGDLLVQLVDAAVADHAPPARDGENEALRIRVATETPPAGYVLVNVRLQSSEKHGHILLLSDPISGRLLPLFVSGTEGRSLDLRLRKQRFERPLTHDLLDAALVELGGKVVRAQVDELVDGTFHGSLVLVANGRTVRLDARPSDAVALAVGAEAAVVVSADVMQARGLSVEDLARAHEHASAEPIAL